MVHFKTIIKKFDRQGEKTGWTYIDISAKLAAKLNPGVKTSYRVKGKLDNLLIEKTAILPMGEGAFIMALNAAMRKGIKKQKGAAIEVHLEVDNKALQPDAAFLECLQDEPKAFETFQQLAKGHQNYFSKWIEAAKTEPTKAKRIAMAVNALSKGWGYPEMIRANKKEKEQFGL